MSGAAAVTGHFWLSTRGHQRTCTGGPAAAADCATLRVPASQRALCPTAAQKDAGPRRPGAQPASPRCGRYYAQLPLGPGLPHGVRVQPGRVSAAAAAGGLGDRAGHPEAVRGDRGTGPGDTPVSRWQFQVSYPYYSPHAIGPEVAAATGNSAAARPRSIRRWPGAARLPAGRRVHARAGVRGGRAGRADRLAGRVKRRGAASRRAARNPGAGNPAIRSPSAGDPGNPWPGGRELALACLLFFVTGVAVLLRARHPGVLLALPARGADHPAAGRRARAHGHRRPDPAAAASVRRQRRNGAGLSGHRQRQRPRPLAVARPRRDGSRRMQRTRGRRPWAA